MADTDVVRHDLTVTRARENQILNWDLDPIPLPKGLMRPRAETRLLVEPPVTTLVSDEERVTAPYRSVGKMWVLGANDKAYGGSAWVVAPKAIATAGHGVHSTEFGGWIKQAKFAPRYNVTSDKIYDVSTVYTLKGWVDDEKYPYDMAVCVVTENFAVTEPPLKYQDGIFPPGKFTIIGYPIRPIPHHDFNGKRMWKCVGEFINDSEDMWWAANNLSKGASGGPWCDNNDKTTVYGLTSKRDEDPEVASSPILLNGFENLYNVVKNL